MDVFCKVIMWLLVFILASVLVILFAKAKIFLSVSKKEGKEFACEVKLRLLWGLVKIDLLKGKENGKRLKKDAQNDAADIAKDAADKLNPDFKQKVRKYYGMFCDFKTAYTKKRYCLRSSILAEKIDISINFGVGDAAKTGIYTGHIWAGVYNVIAFIARFIRITEPKVEVNPYYNEKKFEADAECIISTRPVNLIIVLLGIGVRFLLYQRRRSKKIKINKEKAANANVNTN